MTAEVSSTDSLRVSHDSEPPGAAMLAFPIGVAQVVYPRRLRENQTAAVTLTYSIGNAGLYAGVRAGNTRQYPRLRAKFTASLWSSGFEVEPTEPQERLKGSELPARVSWTVTPKGEGKRVLLLSLGEESNPEDSSWARRSGSVWFAMINGAGFPPNAGGTFELPVSVGNYWGVDRRVASLIRWLCTGIAFVLAWPLARPFLERLINLRNKRKRNRSVDGRI